jgi:hypothetical protein
MSAGPRLLLALVLTALRERPIEWEVTEWLETVAPSTLESNDASAESLTYKELRAELLRLKKHCGELEQRVDASFRGGDAVSGNGDEGDRISQDEAPGGAVPVPNTRRTVDEAAVISVSTPGNERLVSLELSEAIEDWAKRLSVIENLDRPEQPTVTACRSASSSLAKNLGIGEGDGVEMKKMAANLFSFDVVRRRA